MQPRHMRMRNAIPALFVAVRPKEAEDTGEILDAHAMDQEAMRTTENDISDAGTSISPGGASSRNKRSANKSEGDSYEEDNVDVEVTAERGTWTACRG